jgi:hypothetical protein
MNRDTSVGENSADNPIVDVTEWEVSPKRKWSRPSVTIIDLKRTMLFGGSNFDGLSPTTGV